MNTHKTYRIILNDKPAGYKPDKDTLKRLRRKLPDMKVHGFGIYGFNNLWYLLVESEQFPFNLLGFTSSLSINAIK